MHSGGPMELNFKGLGMQKWNIPTDKTKKLDEKNGAICLVIMFTLSFMFIKMLKMVYFLYFQLMTAKNSSQFGQNI